MKTYRPPAFVLTASRSGSTLLRILLDSHPQICAPPETNLGRACTAMLRSWQASHPGLGQVDPLRPEWSTMRDSLAAPLDDLLRHNGKQMWCEKSIDNVWASETLAKLFPTAHFIFLHRHCLDMVYSGLEASRWGFRAYGFEDYVRASPGNTVEALVRCWCDTVEASLQCEDREPSRVHRCAYEQLTTDTDTELDRLFEFLEVDAAPRLASSAFAIDHQLGSGDHKLPFTSGVESGHLHRGRRIPVGSIGTALRARMNESLTRLGYPEVTEDWNHTPTSPRGFVGDRPPPLVASLLRRNNFDPMPDQPPKTAMYIDDANISLTVDNTDTISVVAGYVTAHNQVIIESSNALLDIVLERVNIGLLLREGIIRTRSSVSATAAMTMLLRAEHRQAKHNS